MAGFLSPSFGAAFEIYALSCMYGGSKLQCQAIRGSLQLTLDIIQPPRATATTTSWQLKDAFPHNNMAESSLAADLLADFNDSDEEELDGNATSVMDNGLADRPSGRRPRSHDLVMDLDGDEEADDDDEDDEMGGVDRSTGGRHKRDLSIDDDEETRKTKVESMHLGGVDDVRSVARLMKVLEPVLEVKAAGFSFLPFAFIVFIGGLF